jgi:hypothetical protein
VVETLASNGFRPRRLTSCCDGVVVDEGAWEEIMFLGFRIPAGG